MTAPNHFELEGEGVQVTYAATSIDGRPLLTYRSDVVDLSFGGDEIEVATSPLGTLVTVVLVRVPDHRTTTFTLLVPEVRLDEGDVDGTEVTTEGVTVDHRDGIAPGALRGQLQRYTTRTLTGRARVVAS